MMIGIGSQVTRGAQSNQVFPFTIGRVVVEVVDRQDLCPIYARFTGPIASFSAFLANPICLLLDLGSDLWPIGRVKVFVSWHFVSPAYS